MRVCWGTGKFSIVAMVVMSQTGHFRKGVLSTVFHTVGADVVRAPSTLTGEYLAAYVNDSN